MYTRRKISKHFGFSWHEKLGLGECPYLHRWTLRMGAFSLRLHHFLSSDDDRALHDHPWWFVTLVLKGGYTDVSEDQVSFCSRCAGDDPECYICHGKKARFQKDDHLGVGSVRFRPALHRHTVRVDPGGVWTLVLTGPARRAWGFWPEGKFKKANKYFFERGHHPCDEP